ncbi:MAG: BMP family ABC transporter substrate-binding protein, partial [Candidatus Bathyarchaeia archaeon]
NAYEFAAKLVNPKVKVLKTYAGSWTDPAKGKETALSMFDAGADHLGKYAAMSDLGGFDACKERSVYTTGIYLDQSPLAPELTLANFLFDPAPILINFMKNTVEGLPVMGGQIPCGFPPMFNSFQKIQRTPAFDKLPSNVKEKFNEVAKEVEKGGYVIIRDETRFAVA